MRPIKHPYLPIYYLSVVVGLLLLAGCSDKKTVPIYNTPEYKQIERKLNAVADTTDLKHWLQVYRQSGNRMGESIVLRRLGRAYRVDNQFGRAILTHKQGLAVADSICDTMEIVNTLNEMGTNYRRLGAMYLATSSMTLGLGYCQQWSDTTAAAFKSQLKILNGLGKIYFTIRNYKVADHYFRRSLAGEIKLGSAYGMGLNYSDIGRVFRAQNNLDSAQYYFQKSMEQKQLLNDEVGMALIHIEYGGLYEDRGDYAQATAEYDKAYITLMAHSDRYLRLWSCIALARVYIKRQMTATAIEYLQEAKMTADEINSPGDRSQIALLYYQIYRKSGNTAKALAAYVDYKNWNDTVMNLEKLGDIQNVQIDELMADNTRKLNYVRKDMERMRKQQESGWLVFTVITITMIVLLAFFYYLLRIRTRTLTAYREFRDARVRFFANISHELRTPVTIIQSAGNSIESQTDNQQIRDEVSQLQEASHRLLHLVDSVVDITNISIRPVDEAPWCHDDIVGYVRMLVEAYRHEAEKRQIRLVVTSKRNKIEADFVPDYVDKILGNLLTDMLRFAYNQSDLYISMSVEKRMLRLELKDRGQGMPPEVVKDLLKPYDSKNTSEIYMHVGLNLQAVQAAIKAMGGDIKLKSKQGEYAQFIVTIPLRHGDHDYPRLTEQKTLHTPAAPSAADTDMPIVVDDDADNKPRILIVEESVQVARYVADQLKNHYKVFFASNGEDGLHKINIAAPDLLITDGVLPVMDGYQLCQAVRAQAATCHIPVVMVSSDSSVQGRMKSFQAGADAFLLKPFRADELLVRVRLLLQQRRMLRDKYAGSAPVVDEADGQAETTDRTPDFIDEVQQYVDSHIGEGDVDLADLAARFGVTRATFTRKVKQHTGLTSAAYITSRRIRKACQLLQTADMTVAQVAEACGYSDTAYFIMVFRKSMNKTPKQYKDEWLKP